MKLHSCGTQGRSILPLLLAIPLFFAVGVSAQSDEAMPKSKLRYLRDVNQAERPVAQLENGSGTVVEVPYSKVFKDTDEVDLFKAGHMDPYESRFGSGGARVEGGIINGRFGLPFTGKGFRVDEAEIKLSNFYIDLRSLSASVLYSDNVNRSEFDRKDGTIVALRLDFAVFAPLTERLRISAAGAFLYLPIENRFGFAVFDPFRQFEYYPYFRTQLAYDLTVGHWEIEVMDDLTIAQVPFDFQLSYSYFDGAFENSQREGRYTYNTGVSGQSTRVYEDRSRYGRFDAGLVQVVNTVGGRVGRLLPTETRLEFGAYHADFWYLSGDENIIGLPRTGEWAYASLKSERESLRFKPFAIYNAFHYNYYKDWEHQVLAGFQGPVTENIDVYGAFGERWLSFGGGETIWDGRIRHKIGPYTSHSFEFGRDVTEPDRDLRDRWVYRVTQVIGAGLTFDAYGAYDKYVDLDKTGTGGDDWRAGGRLTFVPSPKTMIQMMGTYTQHDFDVANAPDSYTWRGAFSIRYKFTPTFETRMQYEYTDRNSTLRGDSYYENLGIISLIKYF